MAVKITRRDTGETGSSAAGKTAASPSGKVRITVRDDSEAKLQGAVVVNTPAQSKAWKKSTESEAKSTESTAQQSNRSGAGRRQVLESRINSGTANSSDYQSLLKLAEAGVRNAEKAKANVQNSAAAIIGNRNLTQQELEAAKSGIEDAERRISDWETYRDSTAKGAYYDSLAQNADFAEKSRYSPSGSIENVQTRVNPTTMEVYRTGSGVDDLYYRAINGDAEALRMMPEAKKSDSLALSYLGDGENLAHMTEDEIARFNYLYSQDREEAWRYIEYLTPSLNKRQRELAQEQAAEYADEHPVVGSLVTNAMSIPKGAAYVGQVLDYLDDGKVDQNANYNRFSYVPADIRSEITQNVGKNATKGITDTATRLLGTEKGEKFAQAWGESASWLYGVGMSMLDNVAQLAASTVVGGVTGLTKKGIESAVLTIMSTGAAADAARESLESGDDYTRAMTLSAVAGAIEAVTEKMGLDALFDTALRGRSAFTYMMKHNLSEAAEEGASDVFNWIADGTYDLITGQNESEWKQQIAEYMANGYSESEAFGLALAAHAKELGLDMLAGFISGAGLSGLSVAGYEYEKSKAARKTGKVINSANQTQTIIDSGLQQSTDSKAYKLAQQLQQKSAAGQSISNSEIGRLNLEIGRAAYEQQQKTQFSDFTAKLSESGLDEKASRSLAQSMQMTLNGEEITGGAATRIAQNPTAVSLLQEASGVTINTDAPIAQVKAQIRSIAALAKTQNEAETAQESVSEATGEITPTEEENVTAPLSAENTAMSQLIDEEPNTTESETGTVSEGRSESAIRADRSYMRRAGAIFGENGARAINKAYDAAVAAEYSADDVIKGFSRVYNAVLNGEEVPGVDIPESVKVAAEGAARLDAQRASEAQSHENGGLVKDESFRRAHLSSTQEKLLDGIGRALHAQVKIADNVYDENGSSVNGKYENGVLTVSLESNDPLLTTAIHEAVHRIREVSPESYQELASFVREALGDRHFATALDIYAEAYAGDESFVSEEIVADAMGRVLSDKTAMQRFTELHTELARTLRDVLADVVNAIKRAVGRQNTELSKAKRSNMRGVYERMDEAVRLFDRALERVSEQNKTADAEARSQEKSGRNSKKVSGMEERLSEELAEKVGIAIDTKTDSASPTRFSRKTWNESEYVQERDKAAAELAKALDISVRKAKKYIDSVNSIAKLIGSDTFRWDYEASTGVSSFISNVEYGGSLDFSTICKKRRLMTGTFEAIQKLMPNTAITAEEVLAFRSMMKERGYEVSCGCCYVEGSRAKMGEYVQDFLTKFAETNPDFLPTIADLSTPTGQEHLRVEYPDVYDKFLKYMNKLAQRKPKMYQMATEYNGEIFKMFAGKKDVTTVKNIFGGIRVQSFSDFEIIHAIDMMQAIVDMSRVGLAAQAYTKVPDFAWAFGNTGMKINLSLIAKGVDENGKLIIDEVEGMKRADAEALRNAYPENVGTIVVTFNSRQAKAAMADPFIDFIVPFHRSQWKKAQYDILGLPSPKEIKEATAWQNERYLKPVYSASGAKQRPKNYMPNEYWDFSKSGKENAEAYLKLCAENNRRPKFNLWLHNNGDGSYSLPEDGSADGYWKLLIDFKMYDNNGKGSPQMPVKPDFNMDEINRMLNEYEGGHEKFPVAQDVVDDFVAQYKEKHPKERYSKKADIDTRLADALELQNALAEKLMDYADTITQSTNIEALQEHASRLETQNKALRDTKKGLRETIGEQSREIKKLEKKNKALAESRDRWKNETKRTGKRITDPKAIEKAAKRLLKTYNVDTEHYGLEELTNKLQSLYDGMTFGVDERGEYYSYDSAMEAARDIAEDIAKWAVQENSEYADYFEALALAKKEKYYLEDEFSGELKNAKEDPRTKKYLRLVPEGKAEKSVWNLWETLSENFPDRFRYDANLNPADMLTQILDFFEETDRARNVGLDDAQFDSTVRSVSQEILASFFDIPQVKKTFADRQAEKLAAERGRGTQRLEAEREKNAEKVSRLKEKGREQLAAERAKRDAKIKQLRRESAENTRAQLDRVRADRDEKLEALAKKYEAKTEAGRERQKAKELKGKIIRHAKKLSEKLLRATDKNHIPQELQGAVAQLLGCINQESGYTTDENGKRVKRYALDKNGNRVAGVEGALTKRNEAFRELRDVYERLEANGEITVDPDMRTKLERMAELKDIPLDNLTSGELQEMWDVVKAVEYSVSQAGKALSKAKFKSRLEWASAIEHDTASRKTKVSRLFRKGSSLGLSLENPYTYFSHFGESGRAIYRMLRDAQDQEQIIVDRVKADVAEIVSPKTVTEDESTVHVLRVGEYGERLTLTTSQLMDLYNLTRRKAAEGHLFGGGVVQPELVGTYTQDGQKVKLDIEHGDRGIALLPEDVKQIESMLTAEQKQHAEALQNETHVLAEYGNEASMRAYGYKKFTEPDYWTIKSYSGAIKQEVGKRGEGIAAIKNIGSAKALVPEARNAVELQGVYRTFANHVSDMSTYSAWLCPMEDMNALYNFRFRNERGEDTGNMKELLDRVAGKGAKEYWTKLEGDIQNGINQSDFEPLTTLFSRGIGSFKGAAVGANLRVIIQQPTAFFRAAITLEPKNMAKGIAGGATRGNGWEKALKYAPIAARKEAGGFDIASQSKMINTLFDQRDKVRKVNDFLSTGAEKADAVTWGKLWNACEWQTAENHTELEKGSREFYEETARLFTEVIDQSQVVDGVMQRSNIMRSRSETAKQATSFMGEPIMALNIMMRAYDSIRYEESSAKRAQAIRLAGRAATALVVTNVVNALAQSLPDAWRDDDKDKKYWERFWAAFTGIDGSEETAWDKAWNIVMEGNVGGNLNVVNNIPFVKDVLSLMQGYDVSRTEMEVISDFLTASETMMQAVAGKSKKTIAYATANFLAASGKFFGLPVSNIKRDVWGITRSIAIETDNIAVQYEMEKAIYRIDNSQNKSRFLDLLYTALEQGDMDTYNHIHDDLMSEMGIDGKTIESGLQDRYRKKLAKDSTYKLPDKARNIIGSYDKPKSESSEESFSSANLTKTQYSRYSQQRANAWESVSDELAGSGIFRGLDDERQTKVLSDAYSLAQEIALRDNSDGQYTVSTAWKASYSEAEKVGIGIGEYVMYRNVWQNTDKIISAKGSTVSNSQGLLFMQGLYESGELSQKQIKTLCECYGLSDTICGYSEKEVETALAKCYAKQ